MRRNGLVRRHLLHPGLHLRRLGRLLLAMQAGRDDDDHFGHNFDVFERFADSVRMHGGPGRVRPVWRSRILWRHVLSVRLLLLVQQSVLVAMQSRHVSVVVFDDHDQQLFDYDDEDDHDDFALRDAHGLFRSAGRIRSMRRHRLERSDLLYFGMDLHVLERLLLAMPSRCFIVDDADAELNVLLVLFVINNEIDIDNLDNDIDVEIDHLDDHLDDHHNFVC